MAHWTMTMNAVTSGDHFEQTVQTYYRNLSINNYGTTDFIDPNGESKTDHQRQNNKTSTQMHKQRMKLNIDIENIKQVIQQFKQLQLDGTECGCLKAIALFNPGILHIEINPISYLKFFQFLECRHLINKQDILKLQEQAKYLLINYTNRKFKLQQHQHSTIDGASAHKELFENRFERISLLLLPLLKRISIESIEKIFFHHNLNGPSLSIQMLIECIYNQ